jgi:peroxisomal 2,4-dienoyl-CoA reductase
MHDVYRGRVREIADATVYLFGGAGSFVTGTIVVVDGGAWRMGNAGMGGVEYPEFFRDGKGKIEGVKSGRREEKL